MNAAAPRQYMPSLIPGAALARVGSGLPQERLARVAARRAFVDMKQRFMQAVNGVAGSRGDWLRYDVRGREPMYGPLNSGRGHDSQLSPKLGLAWTAAPAHELYFNAGVGFHSNDVRGATITVDPQTGDAAERVPALVKGKGSELGWRFQPGDGLTVTAALWQLQTASELVYVGDAGTTEPGRASKRRAWRRAASSVGPGRDRAATPLTGPSSLHGSSSDGLRPVGSPYQTLQPPSTTGLCPVIHAPASEARSAESSSWKRR